MVFGVQVPMINMFGQAAQKRARACAATDRAETFLSTNKAIEKDSEIIVDVQTVQLTKRKRTFKPREMIAAESELTAAGL